MSTETDLSYFHDEKSKETLSLHRQMIDKGVYVSFFSHINGDLNRYSHYSMRLTDNEQIISINPMLGGAVKQFAKITNNTCVIHCFEENAIQYMDLCKNIVVWQLEKRVTPVCGAVRSKSGMVGISHNGGSGHFTSGEIIEISDMNRTDVSTAAYAYSLDDYVRTSGFIPTLIESPRPNISEQVINGAQSIIKSYKPKLMLVDSPFSNAPQLLKSMVPEYRIFYSECGQRGAGVYFATIDDVEGMND